MNQIAIAPYLSRLNKMKLITETKSRCGLRLFSAKHYFQTCLIHYKFRRKWLNRYCMKCDKSVCQYCLPLGHHKTHKVLKIYSHLNSDVVRLSAMEKYVECYLIQPYKSNNELVIAMNPLPHCGQPIHNENRKCCICKRILNKPNRYCSISCKVEAFMTKTKMLEPHFLGLRAPIKTRSKKTPAAAFEKSAMRMHMREGNPLQNSPVLNNR